MRGLARTTALTAFMVAGLTGSAFQAQAGVMSIPTKEVISAPSSLEQVHYRYWHHHHHWRHAYWRHHRYYRYYGYYPYYNPAGALAGAAVGLATAPLWAFGGWGYPYYW
jgi:hypothetical protein